MFLVAAPPIGTAFPFADADRAPASPPSLHTAAREGRTPTAERSPTGGPRRPDWDAIAACESSGDWSINTGNGFWGGLQFLPETWFGHGGGPFSGSGVFPYSRAEQIAVAERLRAARGYQPWPACRVKLGLP